MVVLLLVVDWNKMQRDQGQIGEQKAEVSDKSLNSG